MPYLLAGILLAPVGAAGQAGTIVGFDTSLGSFDVELYNADAPGTVANFLNYVTYGDYNSSFFHRLSWGFVLQGGGLTVFGFVRGDGMQVVDWLAAASPNPYNIGIWDANSMHPAWNELPLIDYDVTDPFWPSYLEMVWNVSIVADADGDGRVDQIDYCIWKEHAGADSGADREQGDFDGHGDVDVDDFLILEGSFGRVSYTASPGTGTGTSSVPEPATLSLLAAGGCS